MIDMHIHVVSPKLPGAGYLGDALRGSLEKTAWSVREEMHASGASIALGMGSLDGSDEDPLGIEKTLQIARFVPGLHAIGAADPRRSDREHLDRVGALLASRQAVALKGYLGYVHRYPSDPGYLPYYELAEKHQVPFIFHTGDTFSPYSKLKYAHPLGVDEVAVDFPKVRFVMAHVGNPWTVDAAEVVYKNLNVWVDLSGLVVGSTEEFNRPEYQVSLEDIRDRIRKAFRYSERPNRFLYGSDWPLAPMHVYRNFIQTCIPEDFHELVFDENARRLFHL